MYRGWRRGYMYRGGGGATCIGGRRRGYMYRGGGGATCIGGRRRGYMYRGVEEGLHV